MVPVIELSNSLAVPERPIARVTIGIKYKVGSQSASAKAFRETDASQRCQRFVSSNVLSGWSSVAGEGPMRLIHGFDLIQKTIKNALHDVAAEISSEYKSLAGEPPEREWALVYRTATGFCCVYHDRSVEFNEMLDVQIWAEENDIQTYYVGL